MTTSNAQQPSNATDSTPQAFYSASSLCVPPLDETYGSSTMLEEMFLEQMQLVSPQETCEPAPAIPGLAVITTSTTAQAAKEEMSPQSKQSLRRRIRNAAPERRAVHNATERARRESLNGKFQLLATMLPNLQHFRKPSKSQIIEKALEWVEHTVYNEERYAWQMQQLEHENHWLKEQLHKLGVECQQPPPMTPTTSLPSPPPSNTSTTTVNTTVNAHLPPSSSPSTMDSRNYGHLVTPHSLSQ